MPKRATNDEKDLKDGLAPLADANRLKAILIQFPWAVETRRRTGDVSSISCIRLQGLALVAEVRRAS